MEGQPQLVPRQLQTEWERPRVAGVARVVEGVHREPEPEPPPKNKKTNNKQTNMGWTGMVWYGLGVGGMDKSTRK